MRVKPKDLAAARSNAFPRRWACATVLPVLEYAASWRSPMWSGAPATVQDSRGSPSDPGGGRAVHDRGVVVSEPGMYFMGLIFQYAVRL